MSTDAAALASGAIAPPGQAYLGAGTFRALGGLMVLLAIGYVVACALSRGRRWHWRGRTLQRHRRNSR